MGLIRRDLQFRGSSAIIALIPFGEFAEAFAEGDFGGEAVITLQGGGVGIGDGDIAGLHGDELFVGLEIEVLGEDACANEFFLEDGHEVEEVLGLTATDIIDGIGWDGKTIVAILALWRALHHADNAFDNVIDIGEVALAVAVVEDLDGLALQQLVGKAEVGHVGAAGWAVDGEEAEACCGNVIEFGIAMGEELIALFGGGVEGYGIIYAVIG